DGDGVADRRSAQVQGPGLGEGQVDAERLEQPDEGDDVDDGVEQGAEAEQPQPSRHGQQAPEVPPRLAGETADPLDDLAAGGGDAPQDRPPTTIAARITSSTTPRTGKSNPSEPVRPAQTKKTVSHASRPAHVITD